MMKLRAIKEIYKHWKEHKSSLFYCCRLNLCILTRLSIFLSVLPNVVSLFFCSSMIWADEFIVEYYMMRYIFWISCFCVLLYWAFAIASLRTLNWFYRAYVTADTTAIFFGFHIILASWESCQCFQLVSAMNQRPQDPWIVLKILWGLLCNSSKVFSLTI